MTELELEILDNSLVDGYIALARMKGGGAPDEDVSLEVLDAFERALTRIRKRELSTQRVVMDADLRTLREIRALVAAWDRTAEPPEGLPAKAAELLGARKRRASRKPGGVNLTAEEMEVLTDGLFEGFAFLQGLKEGGAAPGQESTNLLDAFERSLLRIHEREVTTSMFVNADDLQTLRDLREMVEEWKRTGKCPDGLPAKADSLLALDGP